EADRSGNPSVTTRWLGGTLTNFQTMQTCLASLEKIQQKKDTGLVDDMPKKERAAMEKEYERLMRNLGGIRNMKDRPGALFIVDPSKEHIAVAEAACIGIPIVAITDTNCDPDPINYIIPGNDDAVKSIKLFCTSVADAYLEGAKNFEERARANSDKRGVERESVSPGAEATDATADFTPGTTKTTDREGRTVDVQVRRSIKPTSN
ncbi:MAG: 30S ribosomal protein S2, partial [Bdellovibrionota bacterium]